MGKYQLDYKTYGPTAILIEWPQQINEAILKDIQNFQVVIENKLHKYVIECIPAYTSLTILFKEINFNNIRDKLQLIYEVGFNEKKSSTIVWHLPVCYSPTLGFDLEDYSKAVNLSIEEIIQIHTKTIYTVYFIGFLPGFLYLGNLDERLFLNRKSKPLLKIPKGAVGIGGKQTGIYPQASPGGWHIIGNCPVTLFNVNENPPSVFKAGDQVQFLPIKIDVFKQKIFSIPKKRPNA